MTNNQKSSATVVPALPDCLPPSAGPARLIHDATLPRPLRVRDSAGIKLAPEIHDALAEPLGCLSGLLDPLALHYLRADPDPWAGAATGLDGRRIGCLPRLLYAHAATSEQLQGVALTLRLSLQTVPSEPTTSTLDTRTTVQADDAALAEPAVDRAVRMYAEFVTRTWARCAATTLGPWVVSSGVRELRLTGNFVPDRRQQLAVLAGADIGEAAQL
jgi:hypothetical protein